ncbi:hypothetical protein XENOCAPTIV_005191 [Xenoophorus captivus]|uniref:Uncharacterized protein n=1 Tax=Xenoophorus captivus TaxID=1517983 RepID=A0ABV0RH59_9TELE
MRARGLMVETGFKLMKYSEVARESCKKHTLPIASFEASKTSGVMMNNESVTANFFPPRQSVSLQTFLENNIRNRKREWLKETTLPHGNSIWNALQKYSHPWPFPIPSFKHLMINCFIHHTKIKYVRHNC